MASHFRHKPVLLDEVLEHLDLHPGAVVVDGTLGGGGHAEAILERVGPEGTLLGLDVDEDALLAAQQRLSGFGESLRLVRSSFRDLPSVLASEGIQSVNAVLLDLGVSSYQLDVAERGFRFAAETAASTPLDMRMDQGGPISAADLLRRASADELEGWFREYGELRGAGRLARTIVEQREQAPFENTADLLRAVRDAGVGRGRKHDPATLVFQALRIAVNDELGALRDGLDAAIGALAPGGRLVVLSYHSLEDRIVKQALRLEAKGCDCPPRQPICNCGRSVRVELVTRKPVRASDSEIRENPRARSARLRAATRVSKAEAA